MRGCKQAYHKDASADLVVLDDVNLMPARGRDGGAAGPLGLGQIDAAAHRGRPAGADRGEVLWRDRPMHGPAEGVAMVFQSFALFPWLTVQENVEMGLEARGVARAERESRAEAAIDLIGLGGFESAYPKELSGGMRQRVFQENFGGLIFNQPERAIKIHACRGRVLQCHPGSRAPDQCLGIIWIRGQRGIEKRAGLRRLPVGEGESATRAREPRSVRRKFRRPQVIRLGGDRVIVPRIKLAPLQVEGGIRGRRRDLGIEPGQRLLDFRVRTKRQCPGESGNQNQGAH